MQQPPMSMGATTFGAVLAGKRSIRAEAKGKMPNRPPGSENLIYVQGFVVVAGIAATTILVIAGHQVGVPLITGFITIALSHLLGQSGARADRKEIREQVKDTKASAQAAAVSAGDAAAKVNGVTIEAMEALKAQHAHELDAQAAALEAKHQAAIAALREEHKRERHKDDGVRQGMQSNLDLKDQKIEQLLMRIGRLEGENQECRSMIAKLEAKVGGGGGENI